MTNRQYFSAVGKRKTAIARVKLFQDGTGSVTVNGLKIKDYFFGMLTENALAPLKITNQMKTYDIEATTKGGGNNAQSDAIRHAISRALLVISPEMRATLKPAGFLRRDARIKERKKPGLKRARRAPQFSKR